MPRALFLRCLLALALVVQGLPASAMDAHPHAPMPAASASAHDAPDAMPDCHGDDPAPAPAAQPDCCDDGGRCGCDGLHSPSLVLAVRLSPTWVVPASGPPVRDARGPVSTVALPSLRPPIA